MINKSIKIPWGGGGGGGPAVAGFQHSTSVTHCCTLWRALCVLERRFGVRLLEGFGTGHCTLNS